MFHHLTSIVQCHAPLRLTHRTAKNKKPPLGESDGSEFTLPKIMRGVLGA